MLTKLKKENFSTKETIHQKLKLNYKIINKNLIVDLDFFLYKYDLYWKNVDLYIEYESITKLWDSINSRETITWKSFKINWPHKTISIDLTKFNIYSYSGKYIDLKVNLVLNINDKLILGTYIKNELDYSIPNKTKNPQILNKLKIESFANKFKKLSIINKNIILFIGIIWLIWIMYFYYLFSFISFLFSSWIIFGLFILITNLILKNNINFYLKKSYYFWDINKNHELSQIIWWKSKIDLNNISIRVIASNIEKWQYTTTTKNKLTKRKETYRYGLKKQINWIILYEEKIWFIPKNNNIDKYIKWTFSFQKMLNQLYPPIEVWNYEHWIDLIWKIQLINENKIYKSFIWNNKYFKYKNFINKI